MKRWKKQIGFLVVVLGVCGSSMVQAETIEVSAQVQQEIYLGEPFRYQIHIDGYEQPGTVDTSVLGEWAPRSMGGQNVSQRSITIINGRRSEKKIKRYIMAYQLTAPKAGTMVIPALTVEIEGRFYKTNPVGINVLKPLTSDKLGLEMILSQNKCFIGQPVTLTINWYIGVNVGDFHLSVPALLDSENFIIDDVQMPTKSKNELLQIDLAGGPVTAIKKRGTYKGNNCIVVSFSKILIPRRVGRIDLAAPNITCNVEVSGRRSRRDLWDSFFRSDRQYRRYSSQGQTKVLTVKALPDKGRPNDFTGLVGRYWINATASPTKVNVGDPITLTVSIGGELFKHLEMPDLGGLPGVSENFKIPSDQATPKITATEKVFTQTIRATNSEVSEIPAIPLSYFNVDKAQYVTVYSKAIPLDVAETKIVKASEGLGGQIAARSSEIKAVQKGIAANYEGPELLIDEAFMPLAALTKPAYLVLWAAPILIFMVSLVVRLVGANDPVRQKMRQQTGAYRQATKWLRHISGQKPNAKEQIADVMRQYVGDRFDRTPQSLTSHDCKDILSENCRNTQEVEQFYKLLETCEQSRFAGGTADSEKINTAEIAEIIRKLDRNIKK